MATVRRLIGPGVRREAAPALALVASEGSARLLSFAFYLVAARELAPEGFGVLRYTIALATIAFGLLQVLATALARELGGLRHQPRRRATLLGTAMVVVPPLWLATLALTVVAAALGLTAGADLLGLLCVSTGLTGFTLYYSIARGEGRMGRAAISYVGGSATQLVALVALGSAESPGASLSLLVFGASSLVPVIAYEIWSPMLRGRLGRPDRDAWRALWTLAHPLVLAQVGYLVLASADQIWVQAQMGSTDVGLYAAARNVAQLFVVLSAGVNGFLLPRLAELRATGDERRARWLIVGSLGALLGSSFVLAFALVIARHPVLGLLYGRPYEAAAGALTALALSSIAQLFFLTLTNAAVGWGRPKIYTGGVLAAALLQVAALFALSPSAIAAVGWTTGGAHLLATLLVLVRLKVRPL